MSARWLRCKVRPGMFSTEFLVTIEVPGKGELTSFFVDTQLVQIDEEPARTRPVEGRVRVYARDEGDDAIVMLPVSTIEHGLNVKVPADLLAS